MSGRVLVVDADYDTLDALANAIRARGHHVALARDGRAGLQSAVEIAPEVIVVDRDVPIFDIRTFLDVLRDNPRTSHARMFVMGTGDVAHLASIDGRAEPIVKPFNANEIAARIDELLRAARAPKREPELRGDLSQVALFDILQVFAANRRTGRLRVEADGRAGEIWLREGRIVDATRGYANGEKAFYRILANPKGEFLFTPGLAHPDERIRERTEQLLLEAVRRVDEIARIIPDLPPLTATILMSGVRSVPPGISADIAQRLDEPRTIEELIDVLPQHDLEVLAAVRDLLASGVCTVADVHAKVAFCEADEVPALRAATLRRRRGGAEGATRIGVISPRVLDISRFARALSAVREFLPAAEAPTTVADGFLGAIGVIRLGTTELELFALPYDGSLRPAWGVLLGASTVVLHLGPDAPTHDVDEALRALDVCVVRAKSGYDRPTGVVDVVREALDTNSGRAYGR